MASPGALLARARERRPFLDHVVRTWQRYQADTGDRLAAAVTFYWFLSLFPILLLAISLLGYVYGPRSTQVVNSALAGILPGNLIATIGSTLQNAKGPAGVLGIVGLLFSGLGWVDGLRQAIRTIWHQNTSSGNVIVTKVTDVVQLLGLFAVVGASVVVSGATTAASGAVLDLLGVAHTTAAAAVTQLLGYVVGGAADTVLFLYLFTGLPRVRSPFARVLRGALLGAVGFEVLKFAGAYYVARTTTKGQATYGTFAVVVGLLLFLNLVSRLILLAAAFVVTGPYDSDTAPSGTSSAQMARRAGIPTQFADADAQDPPTTGGGGAPAPLLAAVNGLTPPQDQPSGRGTPAAPVPRRGVDQGPADAGAHGGPQAQVADPDGLPAAAPQPRGLRSQGQRPDVPAAEAAVRRAARLTASASALVLAGIGVQAVREVRRLVRR